MTHEQQVYWQQAGGYFGYPKCCVDAFCRMDHMHDPEPRKLNGTGYIPCQWCNDNKTEQQMVNTINFNRHPELEPFTP